jgi:hypothetical protein
MLAIPIAPAMAQQPENTSFVGRAISQPGIERRADGDTPVIGTVLDRQGRPVPGVQVRVSWIGGSMMTQTSAAGSFQVMLGTGPYQVELLNRSASPVSFSLDGQTGMRVEFVETQVGGTPAPGQVGTITPLPSPTGTPPTATPTPRPGTPTPTPRGPTATPTPALTPVPDPGTPIPLVGAAPTARPAQATPTTRPFIRRALEFEFDTEPWIAAFLYGVGLSASAGVFYLVIVAIRR